jgi:glycosyltransferase involved in cell wall biosynthesis
MIARQERRVLARADGVSAASQQLCQLIIGWRGTAPVYLPNTSSLAPVGQDGILPYNQVPGQVVWYTRFLDFPPESAAAIWAEVVLLSPDAHLRVIGAGLRGEEQALADAIAALGLTESVTLCGWLDGNALAAELGTASLAIFPFADTPINRYKCPARLADLTAAGVPVVAHAVGECTAYIHDGETGGLVPPGSIEEFAQAVARLLADSTARERMHGAARQRFAQRFAPDVLAARLEQAYADALDKARQ